MQLHLARTNTFVSTMQRSQTTWQVTAKALVDREYDRPFAHDVLQGQTAIQLQDHEDFWEEMWLKCATPRRPKSGPDSPDSPNLLARFSGLQD